jgi:hypothetical protein
MNLNNPLKPDLYYHIYNRGISSHLFHMKKNFIAITFVLCILISSCNSSDRYDEDSSGAVYVKPSVDYRGRYRKGHVRFKTSTKKDALKSQARSRYYYHTRGKYRKQ